MTVAATGDWVQGRTTRIGVLTMAMALVGCPQKTYYVGITLKNHCNHSVRATTTYAYSNGRYDRSSVIGPLQSDWVAMYRSPSRDIRHALWKDYTLTIDGEGGSQTLGRAEMLVMLDHARVEKGGSHSSTHEISYEPMCKPPPS